MRDLIFGVIGVVVSWAAWAGVDEGLKAYRRQDYALALNEFLEAAGQGDTRAHRNLGVMYALGQGVVADDQQAVVWFRQAAEQGMADAQRSLGVMYETGRGVDKDETQAVVWFRKAAEQGHVPAQFNLGRMYRHGLGVAQDDKEALYWYRKAAEQGDADARNNLGVMYKYAQGVPQSRVIAYALYSASFASDSSSNNKLASDNRNALAVDMTFRELQAAQSLAAKMVKPGMFIPALDAAEKSLLPKP